MKIAVVYKEDNKKALKVASELKNYIGGKNHEFLDEQKIGEADFIVVIGGDGTLIHNASKYCELEIPVIGINTGNVGFLTAAEAVDWKSAVDKMISGEVYISQRIYLKISVGGKVFTAVNEAVIKGLLRVIDLDVVVDGEEFLRIYGDGVIVATQTGSTAYSLSSGGPIVDAELDCLIVTPINPIGLPIPSAVLSSDDEVVVKVAHGEDVSLIVDGQQIEKIAQGAEIKITKSEKKIKLGYFSKHHFLNNLNVKFGLSSRGS